MEGGGNARTKEPLTTAHFLSCGGAVAEIDTLYHSLVDNGGRITTEGWGSNDPCVKLHKILQVIENDDVLRYTKVAKILEECRIATMNWINNEEVFADDEDPDENLNIRLRKARDEAARRKRSKKKNKTCVTRRSL